MTWVSHSSAFVADINEFWEFDTDQQDADWTVRYRDCNRNPQSGLAEWRKGTVLRATFRMAN